MRFGGEAGENEELLHSIYFTIKKYIEQVYDSIIVIVLMYGPNGSHQRK